MIKRRLFISMSLIIIFMMINGCTEYKPRGKEILKDTKTILSTPATSPVKMGISLSKATALGELGEITASVWYTGKIKENMPETIANIELPEGFELVDGDLNWEGYLKNEPQQFSATIKAVEIGNWTIKARIRSPPTGKAYLGGGDNIYISVLEDKGIIYSDDIRTPFTDLNKNERRDMAIKLNDSEIPSKKEIPFNENIITPEPIERDE